MEEKIIKLYRLDYGAEDPVVASGTAKALHQFIGDMAKKHNYGLFRHWHDQGKYFYDCGPATFYTLESIDE